MKTRSVLAAVALAAASGAALAERGLDHIRLAIFWDRLEPADDQFDDDSRPFVEEELRTGRSGLQSYLEAISVMRHWIDTQDRGELKQFLALAAQADTYMNDAVAMNFSNYRTYLESMGEFLYQSGYQGPI